MPRTAIALPLTATTILLAAYLCLTMGLIGDVSSPSLVAPTAIPAAIPYLLLPIDAPPFMAVVGPLVLFVAYFCLFHRSAHSFSTAHLWSARVIVALSAAWFWVGWGDGFRYESDQYTVICGALSLLFFVALEALGRAQVRSSTTSGRLLYSWLLFAWLFSYAFPWLGEVF